MKDSLIVSVIVLSFYCFFILRSNSVSFLSAVYAFEPRINTSVIQIHFD